MFISVLITTLMLCLCVVACYIASLKKISMEQTKKPYEITDVEILCNQDAFEQAVKDGRIAIGRVVEQTQSSSSSSSDSSDSEEKNPKAKAIKGKKMQPKDLARPESAGSVINAVPVKMH
jgi:hypothetical protein